MRRSSAFAVNAVGRMGPVGSLRRRAVTAMIVPGLDDAPTKHSRLLDWVRETAELTMPDRIEWCDGSQEEWERLTAALVEAGTFARLGRKPNSFWAVSDPSDVARVED